MVRDVGGKSQPHCGSLERPHARARNGIRRVANAGIAQSDDCARATFRRANLSLDSGAQLHHRRVLDCDAKR